jgi:hypothetical protein
MKYLLEFWAKEPLGENLKKVYDIEAGRTKKGINFGSNIPFPQHYILSEQRAIMIVEDDEKMSKISKWLKDYYPVMTMKVSPLLSRSEMDKL